MEKSDLDRLLERYVRGEVSPAERVRIEAWLDAIGDKDDAGHQLSKEEEDKILLKLARSIPSSEEFTPPKLKRKLRSDFWILRIAASLLLITVLSYAIWQFTPSGKTQADAVARNEVEKIILNDGSLVWLRGDSKVIYYEKADEPARYATLEGEALFEVAKDPDRPFTVQCGDARVTVLGTSFSIRSAATMVEVTVLAGKVNLSSAGNVVGIDLRPSEKAVYRSNGKFERLETQADEIASLTENTDFDMAFDNREMAEVFRRLERKFDVAIELSDPEIANCRITIDLTDKSLDHSLKLVSEVLNIRYTVDRQTVTISGHGCQ